MVAGVDGCRGGWVIVTAAPAGPLIAVEVAPAIGPVVERVRDGELAVVAVDMPIGLAAAGARACDTDARRRLGPRRSAVFPTPPRPLLGSSTHAEAVDRGRELDGRGISVQAFNLLPRIAELDASIEPTDGDSIVEAHPESGFARMADGPLTTSKKTAEGRGERLALLETHFPGSADLLATRHRGVAADDLLDAAANVWTARRWLHGTAEVLGDGARDARGLIMRIVV